ASLGQTKLWQNAGVESLQNSCKSFVFSNNGALWNIISVIVISYSKEPLNLSVSGQIQF
ncbi:unnamed protein product, partial [Allacma fusca]